MTKSALASPRSERKRGQILAAAKIVFAREGFALAGMEQVARDAAVSTATLYAYFPGKAELFRVVVEDSIADLAERVRASAEAPGDARTRLLAFGHAYAEFYCTPVARALFRLVVAERRRFPAVADHFREHSRVAMGGPLLTILRALVDRGDISVTRLSWAAGQLQGMIEHPTLMLGLMGGDDALPARPLTVIVEDAVDTFLARYEIREKAG